MPSEAARFSRRRSSVSQSRPPTTSSSNTTVQSQPAIHGSSTPKACPSLPSSIRTVLSRGDISESTQGAPFPTDDAMLVANFLESCRFSVSAAFKKVHVHAQPQHLGFRVRYHAGDIGRFCPIGLSAMQDPVCVLPRIPLLGTSVNKGKKRKGRGV